MPEANAAIAPMKALLPTTLCTLKSPFLTQESTIWVLRNKGEHTRPGTDSYVVHGGLTVSASSTTFGFLLPSFFRMSLNTGITLWEVSIQVGAAGETQIAHPCSSERRW